MLHNCTCKTFPPPFLPSSGYSLAFYVYRESQEPSGKTVFKTMFPRGQTGPSENMEVIAPYPTKTLLQYKRFLAQSNGTTYVHDYPELFRQATRALWQQVRPLDCLGRLTAHSLVSFARVRF